MPPGTPRTTALVAHCCLGSEAIQVPSPSLADFFRRTLELEPGFVDAFGCFEKTGGNLVYVTVWETEADARRYEAIHESTIEELRWILEADGSDSMGKG